MNPSRQCVPTNISEPLPTAIEFRKLILKLRWIGDEEQAERLVRHLAKVTPCSVTFVQPRETD
jgi:hypothetical protein